MVELRMRSISEELSEVETLDELKAIWCHWVAEYPEVANHPGAMGELKRALPRVKAILPDSQEVVELLAQVEALKAAAKTNPPVQRAPVARTERKYVLRKTDVSWSTKPQVHAIMHVLAAHAQPGDVLPESQIIEMMVANEHVLQTRQGGKRIWDYYKGEHNEGLLAHGNLEKISC